MKNIYYKILNRINNRKLKRKCIVGNNVVFSSTSSIITFFESNENDIVLGDNVKMYGILHSQNHAKIICGNDVTIGANTLIGAVNSVVIGNGTTISYNVVIMDNNNHPINPEDRKFIFQNPNPAFPLRRMWKISDSSPIVISDNVWIGERSVILKGVTIGENSIVGIGSVVTKNVPPNCIVAGNPAVVVKQNIDLLPRNPDIIEILK